jgi:hypothetical protein
MIAVLKERFEAHITRHPDLEWTYVENRLNSNKDALTVLGRMEESGGEPDVIAFDRESGEIIFCDCSKESPAGRRSLCYDEAALQKRTKNPPIGSAMKQAQDMGVEMMDEQLYRKLQTLEEVDLKSSSWIATPDEIRNLGGALFCERRYGVVFTFHNGADSYYSVRGWRGVLRV